MPEDEVRRPKDSAADQDVDADGDRPHAVEPGPGQTVWRAGDERVVVDPQTDDPYGPESATARPAGDRPTKVDQQKTAGADRPVD